MAAPLLDALGPNTDNGDGSYTFTGGPYAGQKASVAMGTPYLLQGPGGSGDQSGTILPGGIGAPGTSMGLKQGVGDIIGTALKGTLPFAGMGVADAAMGAGGAAAGSGAAGGAGGLGGGTVGGSMIPGAGSIGGAAGAAGGAAGAASPFSGMLGKMGTLLTAAGSGAAQGQLQQAGAQQNQYKTALAGMQAQLERANLASQLQQQDYQNQLRGSLLQGVQDFNVTPPANIAARTGQISGGLRPSAIPDRASIGSGMENSAALDLLGKGNPNAGFTGATSAQMPTLPALPGQPLGGALPYAGAGLNFAGLIANYLKSQQQPTLGGG